MISVDCLIHKKFLIQKNKFQGPNNQNFPLAQNKIINFSYQQFINGLTNLSDTRFCKNQKSLLNKGYNVNSKRNLKKKNLA